MITRRLPDESDFDRLLRTTKIWIDPKEALCTSQFRCLTLEAVGVLFSRLLPYAVDYNLPADPKLRARIAGLSVRRMNRLWAQMERLFETDGERWRLRRDLEWLRVSSVGERQNLRHLAPVLVAYWGHACVYCGREDAALEIEHIVPVARGGTNDLTNLTLACPPCNSSKRTKTAAEFGFPQIHERALRIQ